MTLPSHYERERDCRGCKHLEWVFEIKMCRIKTMVSPEFIKKCSEYKEED